MVRTTALSSSRFGVRVSVVPNTFTIYPYHFLMPENSETLKGSFTKFLGTVRQKISHGNLWYPLLCIKFFDTANFLKHWRDAHEILRHCETKVFDVNLWYPPLCIKFFDTAIFLKYWKDAHEDFRHYETNNFRRKNVISPSIHKMFRYPKFSGHWRDTHELFRLYETKIFDGKTWYPPFHPQNFLKPKIFSKTVEFPNESFRHRET